MTIGELKEKLNNLPEVITDDMEIRLVGIEGLTDTMGYEFGSIPIKKLVLSSNEDGEYIMIVPNGWMGECCLKQFETKIETDSAGNNVMTQRLSDL